MARKQANSKSSWLKQVKQHGAKVALAMVATGSFAFAFGQERIQQFVSSSTETNGKCLEQFYRAAPPYLQKDSLKKDSYPLCFNGFNVVYSGVSKTPLWVAEALTPARLSQKIPREDSFHEEMRVKASHRATLQDYRKSGYDRGHMAPNADMPNKAAQHDSFSLANMVPQAPKNNQQVWRELEEATRALVTKQKNDVYVVTGPVYNAKRLKKIGNGVIVPNATYKAIYVPKTGVIGAYYASNALTEHAPKVEIMSVCALEEQLGINLFPQLTEETKRNTYHLPLTAGAVKANKQIAYANWDAESQCAPEVSSADLKTLQNEFKSDGLVTDSSAQSTQKTMPAPTNTGLDQEQQALLSKLLEMLLQFILQLLGK